MRHFREQQSYTFAELARQTQIPTGLLVALERGDTIPAPASRSANGGSQ
jgi:cytoskeletal protein RodZ